MLDQAAVEEAIKYLDALGLFLYFSVLSEVVFIRPNSLLDIVSKIVSLTFNSTLADLPQNLRIKLVYDDLENLKKGYLRPNVIKALWELKECDDAAILSHTSFLTLLEHLCIISKILLPNAPDNVYFMPCVLPWSPFTRDEESHYTKSVDPIVLTWWNNKPFFYGVFPALVNDMLSSGLELQPGNFKQRRNAVSFSSKQHKGWILLVEDTCQLHLYYTGPSSDCVDILKMVEEGIKNVMHRLNYSNVYKKLHKAFLCPYQNGHDHLAQVNHTDTLNLKCDKHESFQLDSQRQLPWFTKDKQGTVICIINHLSFN